MNDIRLNDILQIGDLDNVKVRFNLMFRDNWNPIELFKSGELSTMLEGQYWNHGRRSFKTGQMTIGFTKIRRKEDLWLLFHVGRVTKDLGIPRGVGYEYEALPEYDKYVGRLIIRFKNRSQTLIRNARSVMDDCYISQILPGTFDSEEFPGYENVHIPWPELGRVVEKDSWNTALRNQKGVYLITDTSNGKMYVGSAYGEDMILGRWTSYARTGHGGNKELKKLSREHIRQYFKYSILDIYKSTTDDQVIIEREGWWKEVLQTRRFGYNEN